MSVVVVLALLLPERQAIKVLRTSGCRAFFHFPNGPLFQQLENGRYHRSGFQCSSGPSSVWVGGPSKGQPYAWYGVFLIIRAPLWLGT